jgi:hypothetical protein
LEVSDLRPGNYFWRVRATAPTGQVSDWTEAQKFVVVPVGQGMGVSVNVAPPEFVGGNIYVLRGKAEPGTTVSVTSRETTAASDGTFQLQITAPPGAREVLLEAMDPEGNKNQYKVALDPLPGRGRK